MVSKTNSYSVAVRLGLAFFMAITMWIYVQHILIPYQLSQGPMRQSPRGNLSDLYPRWLGARELLLHHRNPYGADITREVQIGYYGRLLDPNRPGDPIDQQGFAYPVYVVLLLAPTVMLPFFVVQKVFVWLLAVLTAGSLFLWFRALNWRASRSTICIWILLTLGCFPAIEGMKLQQLSLLVAVFIAAAMAALVRGRLAVAGVLLALASIKPQLVFLVMIWLCIWATGDWRRRQRLVWSFALTMTFLVAAGEILLPGWIAQFRTAMRDYYHYTGGGSVLDVLLSPIVGRIGSAILIVMVFMFAWRSRRTQEDTPSFQWSLSFTLATTLLVIPMFAPYNQLLLLPALMLILRAGRELWKNPASQFFCSITAVLVLWPFFAAACLVIALIFLPGSTVQKAWILPLFSNFHIPIAIYALLLASRSSLACSPETSS